MRTTHSRPALATFVLAVLALAILAPTARAQATALWTNGTSSTANWNDPANWFNGINGFGQAGALVSFNNTDLSGPLTVVLNGTYTLGTFSVGDNAGTRYPYTFSGGILVFNRSGTAAAYNQGANTGPTYLNSAVQLVDDLTFTIQSNASLTLGGSITGARALTKAELGTLILTGASNESTNVTLSRGTLQLGDGGTSGTLGSGTVTMSNSAVLRFNRSDDITVGNTLAGVGIVDQAGPGTLTLTGTNTFSAGVRLNAGALEVGSSDAIGNFGTITFNGGTLRHSAANTTDYSARFSTAANQLYRVDTNGQNLTLASALTSSGGTLTKLGDGTLTLTGANTYDGVTTISGGTLRAGQAGALSANSAYLVETGATLDLNGHSHTLGTLSGNGALLLGAASLSVEQATNSLFSGTLTGSGSLTKLGSGALTLSGNNTYSGGTSLQAGTIEVGSSGALGSSGTIAFNGGTLRFSAANTTDYSARFSTAANQLYRADTNGQNITLASALSSSGGSLTKLGAGTLTLSGNNSYSGPTTVSAGTLQIGNGGTTGSLGSGNVTLQSDTSLTFNRSNDLNVANTLSGSGSLTKLGSGALTLFANNTYSGGTTISAGTLNIIINGTLGSGSVTNNGELAFFVSLPRASNNSISGTGNLSKSGTGRLTLTGSNNYSGTTTILSGALRIGEGGTAGSLGSGEVINNGSLEFNRSDSITVTNVITGLGSLTHFGTGTLTLSANNTYTGGTTLSAGTLALSSAGALGFSSNITFNGGTLQFSAANTTDYSARLSTAANQAYRLDTNGQNVTLASPLTSFGGSLTKLGSGTLTLTANNTYTGTTTVSGGTLTVGNGGTTGALGSAAISVASGSTLAFNRSDAHTIANAISGSGSVSQLGSGTLTLTGNNTYSGGTTTAAGTLAVGSNTAIGTGTVVLNGGTLAATGGARTLLNAVRLDADSTISGSSSLTFLGAMTLARTRELTIDAGSTLTLAGGITQTGGGRTLTKLGDGTLHLIGAGTYTGGTYLGAGTTRINNLSGSAFGTGAVTVEAGATLTGSGSFTGALQLNGTFSPGNSPGTTATGSQTWGGGAGYIWEVNNATGAAGTNYDLLSISGTLTLAATSSNPFTLQLASLLPNNSPGAALNFNAAQNYAYTIATTTDGILGFDTFGYQINTSAFANSLAGGSWSLGLTNSNRDLTLSFTAAAIPEPSTYAALAGLGALAFALYRRRAT